MATFIYNHTLTGPGANASSGAYPIIDGTGNTYKYGYTMAFKQGDTVRMVITHPSGYQVFYTDTETFPNNVENSPDANFTTDANGSIFVNAGSFATTGFNQYQIVTVGNTNFTTIGAANNNVGTNFFATGAGSGTGTAKKVVTSHNSPATFEFTWTGGNTASDFYTRWYFDGKSQPGTVTGNPAYSARAELVKVEAQLTSNVTSVLPGGQITFGLSAVTSGASLYSATAATAAGASLANDWNVTVFNSSGTQMVLASNQLGSWSTSPFLWGRMGDNNNTSTVLTLGSSIPSGTYTAYLTFFNGSTNASSLGNNFYGSNQRVSSVNFVVTSTADSTPSAFNVGANQTSGINSTVTTPTFTPVGYNTATQIAVTGGVKYSLGTGAFTAVAGNISPGQGVRLQYYTGSAYSTPITTTVTIGGVLGTNTTTNQSNWIVTTMNDPGTGSTEAADGDYGLLCRNGSDVVVFTPSWRASNFVAEGNGTLTTGSTTSEIDAEGVTANNSTDVAILVNCPGIQSSYAQPTSVQRLDGKFKITNTAGQNISFTYLVARY